LRQPGTASSAGPKPITEGLSINEIAARYFISPRTAQTHLTHFYNKLGLSSRLAVVKEATKHLDPATLTAGKAADRAPALLRPALVGIGGAERLTRFAAASHTAPSPTPPQP